MSKSPSLVALPHQKTWVPYTLYQNCGLNMLASAVFQWRVRWFIVSCDLVRDKHYKYKFHISALYNMDTTYIVETYKGHRHVTTNIKDYVNVDKEIEMDW